MFVLADVDSLFLQERWAAWNFSLNVFLLVSIASASVRQVGQAHHTWQKILCEHLTSCSRWSLSRCVPHEPQKNLPRLDSKHAGFALTASRSLWCAKMLLCDSESKMEALARLYLVSPRSITNRVNTRIYRKNKTSPRDRSLSLFGTSILTDIYRKKTWTASSFRDEARSLSEDVPSIMGRLTRFHLEGVGKFGQASSLISRRRKCKHKVKFRCLGSWYNSVCFCLFRSMLWRHREWYWPYVIGREPNACNGVFWWVRLLTLRLTFPLEIIYFVDVISSKFSDDNTFLVGWH